jgi:hypothetical protein
MGKLEKNSRKSIANFWKIIYNTKCKKFTNLLTGGI